MSNNSAIFTVFLLLQASSVGGQCANSFKIEALLV